MDINDRPYQTLVSAASALEPKKLKSDSRQARPDASQGIPTAPRKPLGTFTPTLALKDWNRERGFVKPISEFPVADLYVCWNKQAVYLGLYGQDIVEDAFYRNKIVPESDRAEWIVALGDTNRPIRVRLGSGTPPGCDEPAARIVNLSGVYLNTRNIAALELPARLFGKARFKSDDTIALSSTFFTHCRGYRVEWKGQFTLRK